MVLLSWHIHCESSFDECRTVQVAADPQTKQINLGSMLLSTTSTIVDVIVVI